MKFLYTLFIALSLANISHSQTFDTLWTRMYGRGTYDTTGWVTELSDGGLAIICGSQLAGHNEFDMYLVRTDSIGIPLWSRAYGDRRHEIGHHIIETDEGGFLISGETTLDSVNFSARAWIIKADALGDTTWTYTYGGTGSHAYYGIETLDSGYAVVGQTYPSGHFSDIFVLKLGSVGQFQWVQIFGDGDYQSGHFISQTPDSGYVVGGYSRETFYEHDFWVLRLDKNGIALWDSVYGVPNVANIISSGCAAGDGGYVLTGRSGQTNYTLRIDSLGQTAWAREIPTDGDGWYNSVAPTSGGNFILGGSTDVVSRRRDYCLTKISSAGDSLWSFTCGGGDDDHGRCVAQTRDGNFVLLGNSSSFGNTCAYLVKVGEVSSSVKEEASPLPEQTMLLPNYPNPFNASTMIRYYLQQSEIVSLEIYDIIGRRISMTPAALENSGFHQVAWDASNQVSGIYFCRLKCGAQNIVGKMQLIK